MSKINVKCVVCGKNILVFPSHSKRKTCSIGCRKVLLSRTMKGEGNHNFKGGKYFYESKCECGRIKDPRSKKCACCSKRGYPVGGFVVDEERARAVVKNSSSVSEAARKNGCSRQMMAKIIKDMGLNIDHFRYGRGRPIPSGSLFVRGTKRRAGVVKKRALEAGLLSGDVCSTCGLKSVWFGEPLVMELHHVNGNPCDNRLENLRIICPNCHSQTENNKGKKNKKECGGQGEDL